ncbi:MAG: hypothetical protein ACOYM2_05205 [Rectinemataceae bacterium]
MTLRPAVPSPSPLAPGPTAREAFLRAADRKRGLLGWLASLIFYSLLLAALFVFGLLKPNVLDRVPSTIYVTLEDGTTALAASPAPGPEIEAATPPPGLPEPPAPKASALPSPPPPLTPPVKPQARPKASAPSREAMPPPPAVSSARPTTEATPNQTFTSSAVAVTSGSPAATPNQTYRSSEKGNSADTVFGAEAGKAGRNLYVPVYLFLPLPLVVDESLPDKLRDLPGFSTAERRRVFMKFYSRIEGGWRISGNVPLANREELWTLLEDAGYDASTADFKSRNPRPKAVTLRFTVAAADGSGKPRLDKLELVSSSGYGDIDEAVDYAFRKGSYFNATREAVTGSFTYRFD